MPFVSRIIHELATYDGGVIPKASKEVFDDAHLDPGEEDGSRKKSAKNDPSIEQDAKKSTKNKTKPRRNVKIFHLLFFIFNRTRLLFNTSNVSSDVLIVIKGLLLYVSETPLNF